MVEPIKDKSFDLNNTNEYHLSIQVNLDGFSFFIVNPAENQLVAFKHEQLRISNEDFVARRVNEWMEQDEIFSHPFQKVQVIHWSKKFALVPDDLFQPVHPEKIIQLLYADKTKDNIATNALSELNKTLLFTIPAKLEENLRAKFPGCKIYHPLKKISQNLPELHHYNDYGLVLALSHENFYLLLYNKEDILLMNQYRYSHANDLVYYALTALKQLNISPKKTELLLAGTIKKDDQVKVLLELYFNSTNFLSPITTIHFNPVWFDGSEHRFVALY